ncbi:MAG: glycosyltransferase family 2 protein [Pirellulaceae bacterium]|jgi:dolichol-phosphate mannosyltransferase|nr:glycosyltransferase family 2 protein [Pirellulaceae bacterium]MDP7019267.1 glycosyltransferase family 2 protein [Pirellulaceae bacterium]
MSFRFITALPVFNEVNSVDSVLDEVFRHSDHVLVVDDGSTDGTADVLAKRNQPLLSIETHPHNLGYGAALRTAFRFAAKHGFDAVVTVDCDGQHEPRLIGEYVDACEFADIVSGSRYLDNVDSGSAPPERMKVNRQVTAELNQLLGLDLTDSFCGFKAYRVASLQKLKISEHGYAMPLQLWVQAAFAKLKVMELPAPLIYTDEQRSFGEALDNASTRLDYYHRVIETSIAEAKAQYRDADAPDVLCGESVG